MTQVTIALVYYKGLDENYFRMALQSALIQIGMDKYGVQVYLDGTILDNTNREFQVITVPKNISGMPNKIREFMVNNVSTKYIAFWDSDDIYTINRLYKQTQILEEKNLDLCFSNFSFFNENEIFLEDFFSLIGFNKRVINIFDENYLGFGIMTAKVDYLKRMLPFPDVSTLDWWIGIKSKLLNAKSICLHEVQGFYRVHSLSQSRKLHKLELKDFINEKNNKVKLYSLFPDVEELYLRKVFFENINIEADYRVLKEEYLNSKYKNFWGGLMKYENK